MDGADIPTVYQYGPTIAPELAIRLYSRAVFVFKNAEDLPLPLGGD